MRDPATPRTTLQHPAPPCNTLRHPAPPCTTLRHPNNIIIQVKVAKAAFKRLRTLRHPNILKYVDGVDNDQGGCFLK